MSVFVKTGGLRPSRTAFDLSHVYKSTGDMGLLYPVLCQDVIPGDKWIMSNEVVLRFMPMVAPIMHSVNVFVHYYFVPYRLLWNKWESFYSGGADGKDNSEIPLYLTSMTYDNGDPVDAYIYETHIGVGSLFDYLGFGHSQSAYNPSGSTTIGENTTSQGRKCLPVDFPRRAYYFIWNEYYRDQNLQKKVQYMQEHVEDPDYVFPHVVGQIRDINGDNFSTGLMYRNWEKDYFTSALPFVQRGTAPAFPIQGQSFADFSAIQEIVTQPPLPSSVYWNDFVSSNMHVPGPGGSGTEVNIARRNVDGNLGNSFKNTLTKGNTVNLNPSNTFTFNVNDVRLAFQIQKWLERNARGGVRYTEFLRSHFGVSPRDDRLDRPEYIGGTKSPVVISEVLQTSSTDDNSPQANMAGHGLTADRTKAGSYFVQEPGLIMALLSVMPRGAYQNGVNRQWLRRTRYDYYFREFANLGEQAVSSQELYYEYNATNDENESIFGFIPRYDEYRYIPSINTSYMRLDRLQQGFNFWTLTRLFQTRPQLNSSFIQMRGDNSVYKRIFSVEEEPGFVFSVHHMIKAVRPMPYISEPGLIDHF